MMARIIVILFLIIGCEENNFSVHLGIVTDKTFNDRTHRMIIVIDCEDMNFKIEKPMGIEKINRFELKNIMSDLNKGDTVWVQFSKDRKRIYSVNKF